MSLMDLRGKLLTTLLVGNFVMIYDMCYGCIGIGFLLHVY